MTKWNCGELNCSLHQSREERCDNGTWFCGRQTPPCPGHHSPDYRCATGSKWNCGEISCPGHSEYINSCSGGTWFCGKIDPPCPGHAQRFQTCTDTIITPDTQPTITIETPARWGTEIISGLGIRKQQILNLNGTLFDLAVAMLETKTMSSNYPYGDNKLYDSANFGIFKQNWFMIRNSWTSYKNRNLKSADYHTGIELNNSLQHDLNVLHSSINFYGKEKWFAGHRWGESGIIYPSNNILKSIAEYRKAILFIQFQLEQNSQYESDNTRVWVDVPAV